MSASLTCPPQLCLLNLLSLPQRPSSSSVCLSGGRCAGVRAEPQQLHLITVIRPSTSTQLCQCCHPIRSQVRLRWVYTSSLFARCYSASPVAFILTLVSSLHQFCLQPSTPCFFFFLSPWLPSSLLVFFPCLFSSSSLHHFTIYHPSLLCCSPNIIIS